VNVLRQAIQTCRKGGTVSIPGVYGGFLDKLNIGAAFGKGLTLKMGQTHVHKYMPILMDTIINGEVDPTFLITHRPSLDQAAEAYKVFSRRDHGCIKVVMDPTRMASEADQEMFKEEPVHA
jgi:threonine dehydrogenase-like Zn-dependent dehydrogenase